MRRAGLRNRLAGVLACAVLALSIALPPGSARAAVTVVPGLDEPARVELRRLREAARQAKGAAAEEAWERVARFALARARTVGAPPDDSTPDHPDVTAALREACDRLPAPALAAVAAGGAHPVVSAAFCRALERGGGPAGVPAAAEIAGEARDALVAFGGVRGKEFLDRVRRGEQPVSGAGGAQRSVFQVQVRGGDVADSTAPPFRIAEGVRRGVRVAAGAWADRFAVLAHGWPEAPLSAIGEGVATDRPGGPGVVVVAGGEVPALAAIASALVAGVVVADARAPGEVHDSPLWEQALPLDEPTLSLRLASRAGPFGFSDGPALLYPPSYAPGTPRAPYDPFFSFLLRPTSVERGRRLAEVVAARNDVRRVVIAIPAEGGDFDMAAGFLAAAPALGREVTVLEYEPGRRDYAPEARRFAESGAQAILLAGPAEESAEWLAALAKAHLRPFVLGANELDPAGFHANVRAGLEGAIFAGDDWEDRDAALAAHMQMAGDSLGLGADPDFRRGFRFGWMIARAVVEGAWTPTSLRIALEARSLPRPPVHPFFSPVHSRAGAVRKPQDVVVPLFVVKKGIAEPLALP